MASVAFAPLTSRLSRKLFVASRRFADHVRNLIAARRPDLMPTVGGVMYSLRYELTLCSGAEGVYSYKGVTAIFRLAISSSVRGRVLMLREISLYSFQSIGKLNA